LCAISDPPAAPINAPTGGDNIDTEIAEGLKQMALAGHGVAFLPDSTAAAEVAAGRLRRLGGGWEVEMQIRAYRERPTLSRPAPRRVEQLWRLLEQRALSAGQRASPNVSVTDVARDGRVRAASSLSSRRNKSRPRSGAAPRKEQR
jgi:hypothetical protein